MKLLKTALCAAVAAGAMAGAAQAQDLSVNAGVTTEYVYRGLYQAVDAGFGGIDYGTDNWYIGTWFSTVDFAAAEIDFYAGWTPSAGGVDFDLGVIYYGYINDFDGYTDYTTGLVDSSIGGDFWELYGSATVPVGMGWVGGSFAYSPDFFAESGDATYYEISFGFPWQDVEFSGAYGIQTIDETQDDLIFGDDYSTWNFGFSFPVNDRMSADIRYHDTDDDAILFANSNLSLVAAYDGVLVGTLTATFP